MVLSWILGQKEGAEKRRTLNEIRDSRSSAYKEYASSESGYRTLSSLYILSLVVVAGVVAYEKTVVTYRAPFPSGEAKTNITLSVGISLAVTDSALAQLGDGVRRHVERSMDALKQPIPVKMEGRVEEVQMISLRALSSPAPSSSSSLHLSIALVPSKEWPHFSATSVLLTKGKWALVQVRENEDEAKLYARIDQLIFDVLLGIPHLDLIVKRDRRERIEPWQIAAMTPDHQKRLTWDSIGLSSSYSLRVIHLHSSPPPSPSSSPSHPLLLPSLAEFAHRVKNVTELLVKSEHLFDMDVGLFIVEDVQGRSTVTQDNLHRLLREIDTLASPTASVAPQLKMVVIHSERKLVIVDAEGEDVMGAAVSEWGSVVVSDERTTSNLISALRTLLGIDSHLPVAFKREPVPLCDWEVSRLSLRSVVDSSLRTKHAIKALRSLIRDIHNLAFSDELSSLISSSISSLSSALSNPQIPSLEGLKSALTSAESALMHHSLLSLLYFPTEQRFGIFLPLIALYFAPALALLPRVFYYLIYRGK